MSQENVEVVRRVYRGVQHRSLRCLSSISWQKTSRFALMPPFSPRQSPFAVDEEFRRFLAVIDESWEGGGRCSRREKSSPSGDRVVARADWGGRGRASGIDLRSSLTSIYTIRDGEIRKIEYFFDHAKALEAAGLRE